MSIPKCIERKLKAYHEYSLERFRNVIDKICIRFVQRIRIHSRNCYSNICNRTYGTKSKQKTTVATGGPMLVPFPFLKDIEESSINPYPNKCICLIVVVPALTS